MHRTRAMAAVGMAVLFGGAGVAPTVAHAGVPRSCIHPSADPILCPRDTREVLLKVIPSARRRALRAQRPEWVEQVEVQSLERNQLLREILGILEGVAPPDGSRRAR